MSWTTGFFVKAFCKCRVFFQFIDYFHGKHLAVINKSSTGRAVRAELSIVAPIGEIMSRIKVK